MGTLTVGKTIYQYEVTKDSSYSKKSTIEIFTLKEKEIETERHEIRTVYVEEEKFRTVKDKKTGKNKKEKFISRTAKNEKVPIVETSIGFEPIKFGKIDIHTFLFPHQVKEMVKGFIESKNK